LTARSARWPTVAGNERPRVLAGHFSVTGAVLGSERSVMLGRDVMVMLSTIADPAWDYVALGHIHKHHCLTLGRAGVPPVVYSGSLERIDFGEESDEKGFCWVELARGSTAWRFVPTTCRPFVTLRVDVRGRATRADCARSHCAADGRAVVRMIVTADRRCPPVDERAIQYALIDAARTVPRFRQRGAPGPPAPGRDHGWADAGRAVGRYSHEEVPADRIEVLLDYARELFERDE